MNHRSPSFENVKLFLGLLLLASFLFRLPTLFNDFYDVDELSAIVQTHEYFAGDKPGVDFTESKMPLYHAIFKLSYRLSQDYGWVIVHLITILIVFLTSYYIYRICLMLKDHKTGVLASFMYAILISSFNRHFMATNGEIVFNLPVTAGLYYLICFIDGIGAKRIIPLLLTIIMGTAAALVKFHGIIFFIFIMFFFIIYIPYFDKKITKKHVLLFCLTLMCTAAVFIIDYKISGLFAPATIKYIENRLFYVIAKGTDPFYFIVRYVHRQAMLIIWHGILWLPAIVYVISLAKNKFRSGKLNESSVAILFLFTYLITLSGGARLYFHYFMPAYPAMSVLAAITIYSSGQKPAAFVKKRLALFLLIPSFFFLLWNTKDVIIKHYFPDAFYNEGKALYWTRAVLVGSFNDYLLPDASVKEVCEYIKKNTRKNDRLFVWGDGPSLYYFSERRMGIKHMWPKTSIIKYYKLKDENNAESAETAKEIEMKFINDLTNKKPELFIDTSENGFSTFNYPVTPLVRDYVERHYTLINEISKMKIYRIIK